MSSSRQREAIKEIAKKKKPEKKTLIKALVATELRSQMSGSKQTLGASSFLWNDLLTSI